MLRHVFFFFFFFFFFNDTATTEIYTLSLHDALPISGSDLRRRAREGRSLVYRMPDAVIAHILEHALDRKSTRLNSSHVRISYAVFCLKKKKKENTDSWKERGKKRKQAQ